MDLGCQYLPCNQSYPSDRHLQHLPSDASTPLDLGSELGGQCRQISTVCARHLADCESPKKAGAPKSEGEEIENEDSKGAPKAQRGSAKYLWRNSTPAFQRNVYAEIVSLCAKARPVCGVMALVISHHAHLGLELAQNKLSKTALENTATSLAGNLIETLPSLSETLS
eukprot:1158059-Pelagomonas_calceolata.AAC.5